MRGKWMIYGWLGWWGGTFVAGAAEWNWIEISCLWVGLWLLAVSFIKLRSGRPKKLLVAVTILASCLWLSSGLGLYLSINSVQESERGTGWGWISSKIIIDGDLVRFRWTQEQGERYEVRVKLETEQDLNTVQNWSRGIGLRLTGERRSPSEATLIGAFDYRKYLKRQKVNGVLYVDGLHMVLQQPKPIELKSFLNRLKLYSSRQMGKFDGVQASLALKLDDAGRVTSSEPTALFKGLLLGDRSDFDPERFEQFSRLGVGHVLAISGLHVGLVTAAGIWLLRFAGASRRLASDLMLLLIPLYILLTGASPSVIRAGLTTMCGIWLYLRRQPREVWAAMAFVGWGMLLLQPSYAWNVAYQLSFSVTAGILLLTPIILRMWTRGPAWFRSTLAVTTAAQIAAFPLVITYFHHFSWVSWPANLIIVPLICFVVMPLAAILLLLTIFWPHAAMQFAIIPIRITDVVYQIVDGIDRLPGAHLIWAKPSIIWLIIFYSVAGWLIWLAYRDVHSPYRSEVWSWENIEQTAMTTGQSKRVMAGLMIVMIGLIGWAWHPYVPFASPGILSILDVGQGDAIWIRTPTGKNFLIDGGGTNMWQSYSEETWRQRSRPFEVGRDVVVPALRRAGVRRLDGVFATHYDLDHIGGLIAVLERFPTKRLWINGTWRENQTTFQMMQTARNQHIPIGATRTGQAWDIDRYTTLYMLYPDINSSQLQLWPNQNDASMIIYLQIRDKTFLFTGDTVQEIELSLLHSLEGFVEKPLDVMKVAHHGSKTSSSEGWLSYWQPRFAAISVGHRNLYGHPHVDVLQRFRQQNTVVYRTDWHGEIRFRVTFQGKLEVRTACGLFCER